MCEGWAKKKEDPKMVIFENKTFSIAPKKKETHMRQQTKDVAHTPISVQMNGTIIKEKKKAARSPS